jgi:hypothetical protein
MQLFELTQETLASPQIGEHPVSGVGSLRQVRPFHRADRLAVSLSDPTAMQNPRPVQDTLRTPNSALVCTSRQVWPFQANARNRPLTKPVAMQKVKLAQDTEVPKKARLLTRQVRPFHISADDPTAMQNDALRQETLARKPAGGNAMPKGKPSGTAARCAGRTAECAAACAVAGP